MEGKIEITDFLSHLPVYNGIPVPFFSYRYKGEIKVNKVSEYRRNLCAEKGFCGMCGHKLHPRKLFFITNKEGLEKGATSNPPMHSKCADFILNNMWDEIVRDENGDDETIYLVKSKSSKYVFNQNTKNFFFRFSPIKKWEFSFVNKEATLTNIHIAFLSGLHGANKHKLIKIDTEMTIDDFIKNMDSKEFVKKVKRYQDIYGGLGISEFIGGAAAFDSISEPHKQKISEINNLLEANGLMKEFSFR